MVREIMLLLSSFLFAILLGVFGRMIVLIDPAQRPGFLMLLPVAAIGIVTVMTLQAIAFENRPLIERIASTCIGFVIAGIIAGAAFFRLI